MENQDAQNSLRDGGCGVRLRNWLGEFKISPSNAQAVGLRVVGVETEGRNGVLEDYKDPIGAWKIRQDRPGLAKELPIILARIDISWCGGATQEGHEPDAGADLWFEVHAGT